MKIKSITTVSLILVLGVFLFIAGSVQQTDDPGVLLRAAIEKEEVDGELQGAINLYKQIIAKFGSNRAIAAKAQLRIGMCYEKLGLREAQNAYQKVIENYPQQHEEVKTAKERISQLAKALAAATGKPKFRKIHIPANPGNGVLSPDGKRLAFASEGSIWVVPISGKVDPDITGAPVRLTEPMGAQNRFNTLSWSGDGKWITFSASQNGIYIVPSAGGKVKKIPIQQVGNAYYNRLSLSPDGKILAFAGDKGIHTISVEGERGKRLIDTSWGDSVFSPDGKRLAYVNVLDTKNGYESSIWVIESHGGTPTKIYNVSGLAKGPMWSPDGTMIAFIHDQDPKHAYDNKLYIVPDKKSISGSISPLKIELPHEINHLPAGWTSQNSIGLLLGDPALDVIYTVPSSGGIATQVSFAGLTVNHPRWSPDGERIFFRGYGIYSIPSDGGKVATILNNREELYEATAGGGNNVSPDGKKLVFSGARNILKRDDEDSHVEVNIYTIPVEGGEATQITSFPWDPKNPWKGQARFPCWSPDGKRIAFIRDHMNKENNHVMNIFIVPSAGGEPQQITSESHRVAWAAIDWSPDEKQIAYFSRDKSINLLTLEGGTVRTLVKVDGINGHWELSWSPDGKKIAYSCKGRIYTVPVGGGQPVEVKTGLDAEASNLDWSPDGKMIAFVATKSETSELWLIEDFLHLIKDQK